ncbi:MAG: hypothetical protein QOJ89_2283 [bacterium]|jgi:hypothetical protein
MSGAMLTALVALTSGGLALFFQIRPDLLPDPRTHRGASAVVFAVDAGVTLGRFLERRSSIVSRQEHEKERAAYVDDAEERSGTNGAGVLGLPGEDVLVRLTVEGFKSRSVAMLASLYDADTQQRVPDLSDVPVFGQRVDAPSDQSVVELWMPAPPVSVARYFVRVAVYHRDDGVLLAVADSKAVRADDG